MKERQRQIKQAMKQPKTMPQYYVDIFDAMDTWPHEDKSAWAKAHDTATVNGQVDGAKVQIMHDLLKKNSPMLDNEFVRELSDFLRQTDKQ